MIHRSRILVTGAAGFAGLHLVRELNRRGWTVYGLARRKSQFPALRAAGAKPLLGDLTRPSDLRRAVRLSKPAACAHLAAGAFVPDADRDPARARLVIVGGTLNLVRALPPGCRLLLVSSGMVYGPAKRRLPDESTSPAPANLYSRLKLAAEALAPDAILARPFNHAGPGQDPRFVVSDFARQVARIEAGSQPPTMQVGDLSSIRSFCDVRDMARAYADLVERGLPGRIYNVAGPEASIRSVLGGLRRLSKTRIRVVSTAKKRRGTSRVAGSAGRIRRELGWKPRISLSRTLKDVLSEWRKKENT